MDPSDQSSVYLCPVHKVLQYGIKRESFEKELHEAIVNASMELSHSLYKTVIHGCHCQANYVRFDKLTTTPPTSTT